MSMGTRRLTVAQAVVRFLANAVQRARRRRAAPHSPAASASSGTATSPDSARRCWKRRSRTRRRCHTTRAATSRPWCTPRSAYARMKDRLSTFACTASVGPGGDQHAYRRCSGDHQPAARFCCYPATSSRPGCRARSSRSSRIPPATTSPSTMHSGRSPASSTGCGGRSSCRRRCSERCGCSPTQSRRAP